MGIRKSLAFCCACVAWSVFSAAAIAARAQSFAPPDEPAFGAPTVAFGSGSGEVLQVQGKIARLPDGGLQLEITAAIKAGWHIYSITQPPGGPVRTDIKLPASNDYELTGNFTADPAPEKKQDDSFGQPITVETHEGKVTWRAPLKLKPGVDLSRLRIEGKVKAQACSSNSCLPPASVPFTATAEAGNPPQTGLAAAPAVSNHPPASNPPAGPPSGNADGPPDPAPPAGTHELSAAPPDLARLVSTSTAASHPPLSVTTDASPADLRAGPADWQHEVSPAAERNSTSLVTAIFLGFLGGLVLNIMPCVLPVIGLKILAFIEQSGEDRGAVLKLNLWYSAGLMSVFLLLALLFITAGLGWGQQFTQQWFNVTCAAVLFALALSFLGVWEVPIPGFVGRGVASDLAGKEGALGAFSKGVLSTVLATPCGAPMLGFALFWLHDHPGAGNALAVYLSAGLGMATPYLLIGAFPELMRFLPKPGAWMETFRQVMGFVMLGVVVYLFSVLQWANTVPTFALLVGVWIGCWWIGRVSPIAEPAVKNRAWFEGAAAIGVAWLIAFSGVGEALTARLPAAWQVGNLQQVMQSRYQSDVDLAVARRLETLTQSKEFAAVVGESNGPGASEKVRQTLLTLCDDAARRERPGSRAELPWRPFTRHTLDSHLAAGKTVLVDFTANWCLTCKALEKAVLNTEETRKAIEDHDVVTLKADWTDGDAEVTSMLNNLGSKQVPVVAIFHAGSSPPIVFRGGYTREQLLQALRAVKRG